MKNNMHQMQKKQHGKGDFSSLLVILVSVSSRSIWEDHIALIRKHNLEADLGLHTYTLGMNKYGDMVCSQENSHEI